ncbi:hypothetical protein [Nocardioides sp. Leaf374]|uniref:hypothetical protein n=1 Tax=Nocardioides sp. Leaf374 TaxID=2876560 RepID=UPI001E5AF2C9|nr:hypothetical protein [Nocardioides sp. Leaf374]
MNLVLSLFVGWMLLSVPLGLAVAAVLRGPRRRLRVGSLTPVPVVGDNALMDVA